MNINNTVLRLIILFQIARIPLATCFITRLQAINYHRGSPHQNQLQYATGPVHVVQSFLFSAKPNLPHDSSRHRQQRTTSFPVVGVGRNNHHHHHHHHHRHASSSSASTKSILQSQETTTTTTTRTRVCLNNRHSASDWLHNLQTLPKSSVLKEIRNPVLAVAGWSTILSMIYTILNRCGRGLWAQGLCVPHSAHSFFVSSLGLLLVFRTNSAYQRFLVRGGLRLVEHLVWTNRNRCISDCGLLSRVLSLSLSLIQTHIHTSIRLSTMPFYRRDGKYGKTY